MKKTLIVTAFSAFLLSACSDPKDPTKENFKAAITASLARQAEAKPNSTQVCFDLRGAEVDVDANTARILSPDDPSGSRIRGSKTFAVLDSLHSTGFATRESETTPLRTRNVTYLIYSLDPEKAHIVSSQPLGLLSPRTQVCGGSVAIADVIAFTEPVDSPMGRVVTVDARMRIDSPAPWLTSESMLSAHPELKQQVADGFDMKFNLVLKNTGWETINLP